MPSQPAKDATVRSSEPQRQSLNCRRRQLLAIAKTKLGEAFRLHGCGIIAPRCLAVRAHSYENRSFALLE